MEVPGHGIVKIPALVIKTVIMGYSLKGDSLGCVELIPDNNPSHVSLPQNRQGTEKKPSYGPKAYGILIGTNV